MISASLVKELRELTGAGMLDCKKALEATLEAITEAVKNDEKVALIGFGTFETAVRAARQGINPATKETINIPEKKIVKFKASSNILD